MEDDQIAHLQYDHSHTPWLVILYKYLQLWKQMHEGQMPKNYKEKNQLKEMIKKGILINENGVPETEENFDEAVKNVNAALVPTSVPSEVQKLFDNPCCTDLNSESKTFWILCRALRDFVLNEGKGCLPLRGTIPDMTADSERYIQLQTVYRDQAGADIAVIRDRVHSLLQDIGRVSSLCLLVLSCCVSGVCTVLRDICL